ncbi:MAG: hypothetical protein WC089_03690 [Candidatus Paceibacterota bacterium]
MTIDYRITKEEHLWTSDEKIKWFGHGEWVEELDTIEFDYLGYQARVNRIVFKEPYSKKEHYFGGHLCGYVRIPNDHNIYLKKYNADELDCHGGITFNEMHEEHWVGFDCAHSGDYLPSTEYLYKTDPQMIAIRKCFSLPKGYEKFGLFNPVYRNMEYCIQECIGIIDQLVTLAKVPL